MHAHSRGDVLNINKCDQYIPNDIFFYIYSPINMLFNPSFISLFPSGLFSSCLPTELTLACFCLFVFKYKFSGQKKKKCYFTFCWSENIFVLPVVWKIVFIDHGLFRMAVIFFLLCKVSFHYPLPVIISIEKNFFLIAAPLKIRYPFFSWCFNIFHLAFGF